MTSPSGLDIHGEEFLRLLMKRQLRLSLLCAASFLLALLGLPLANYLFPEVMSREVFGFTLSWLVLGIGFFPAVWVIAFVFIRRSIRLEEAEVREARKNGGDPEAAPRSKSHGTATPA